MKLLFENWRGYLNEEHEFGEQMSRDNFVCRPNQGYGVEYYRIDRNNPPTIEQISRCWVNNEGHISDGNINAYKPAYYSTEELTPFREYAKERLRRATSARLDPDDNRYEELKADIKQNGIEDSIIIFIGLNGKAKIGEGNHRHQIALELGLEKVPVRFIFQRNVSSRGGNAVTVTEPYVGGGRR